MVIGRYLSTHQFNRPAVSEHAMSVRLPPSHLQHAPYPHPERSSPRQRPLVCHAPGIFRPSHPLTFHFYIPFTSRPFIFLKSRSNKGTKAKTTVVLMIQETRYYCYKRTTRLIVVITVPVPNVVLALAIGYSFVKPISPFFQQPLDELMSPTIAFRHLLLHNQPLLKGRDCQGRRDRDR